MASKLPPTKSPSSPEVLWSASNTREIEISARATNPYRAPNVIVEDRTKFGKFKSRISRTARFR